MQVLDSQGFVVLQGAIPPDWLLPLQDAFDAGILPSDQWPVPRGHNWIHAQIDQHPLVQSLCRLPAILDCVRHVLGQPFFLSQIEGREPVVGNAPQLLHRDGAGMPGQYMAVMVWLDPYDAHNGATQIVSGSHKPGFDDATDAVVLTGNAGDVLIFDPEVLHGATTNHSGARRRSFLISYAAATLREQLTQTERLRNVTMDTSEIFN